MSAQQKDKFFESHIEKKKRIERLCKSCVKQAEEGRRRMPRDKLPKKDA